MSGEEFNISSPKQQEKCFLIKYKIVEKVKKTKSGQYSTSEETLIKTEGKHQIVNLILEYRGLKVTINLCKCSTIID